MSKIQLISEPKKKLLALLLQDKRINSVVLTNDEIPLLLVELESTGGIGFLMIP